MLQNVKVASFTVFELLRENQQGGGGKNYLPHTQIKEVCKIYCSQNDRYS